MFQSVLNDVTEVVTGLVEKHLNYNLNLNLLSTQTLYNSIHYQLHNELRVFTLDKEKARPYVTLDKVLTRKMFK